MPYGAVFRDEVGYLMRNNGFFRIGNVYYRWMKKEQIVITLSYEMLCACRDFRITTSLNCYVDGIGYDSTKKKDLWFQDIDMIAYNQELLRKNGFPVTNYNGSEKYTDEEFRSRLKDVIEFYNIYLFPDVLKISSLDEVFEFKDYIRRYCYGDNVYTSLELLYEAIQLRKYNYAKNVINYWLQNRSRLFEEFVEEIQYIYLCIERDNVIELDRFISKRIKESEERYSEYFSRHKFKT